MPTSGTTGRRARATGEVLTRTALNRAFLARQHLIERSNISAEEMVAHLVGLQAQAPNPPYYGLWTRLLQFQPEDLSRLMEQRRVVRISLMRSTIHLVTAADCLALRPLMASVHFKAFKNSYGRFLTGLDYEEIAAAGRVLVDVQPRTFKELEILLGERWPDREPRALAQTVRTLVPLVQVPPRGLWGQSGQAAHTPAERWLGQPLAMEPDLEAMVRRYLAAFGPASVQDIQVWSGLTGLRAIVERLRPELLTFRDERGRELFDLPEAPRPHPEHPVPPRFLAEFDNALLSHDDRTRIISDGDRKVVFTVNGIIKGTVLIDGCVAGTWKTGFVRTAATLSIELFRMAGKRDRELLAEEGNRLLDFAAPDSVSREIQFTS